MAKTTRLFKSFSRLLLPVIVLALISTAVASVWLVHETSRPQSSSYLVTPEKYGQLSARGAQITDETWRNTDGTASRGWLLRGLPGMPAVVLLHKFGADRSHVLNLGVKLNEATNFTVLMPDQRGHGKDPSVKYGSFGGCEASDTLAALNFLRSQKNEFQTPLVGPSIGIYGLEMGALAALSAASQNNGIAALVLDSVPQSSDAVLANAVGQRFPFASTVTSRFGQLGTYAYYYEGCYDRHAACELAKQVGLRKVMLLGGIDAPEFQDSTAKLARCFPQTTTVNSITDLSPSGYSMMNASIELSEAYDQRVIDFFRQALSQ